jgi:hypothetical protein
MMKVFLWVTIALFTVLNGSNVPAEEGSTKEKRAPSFSGDVLMVDCAAAEIKIGGKKGEGAFHIGKEVRYRNARGCEDIAVGGRVFVTYEEKEGKKDVHTLIYSASKQEAVKSGGKEKTPGERKPAFMGWVTGIDCEKGTMTIGRIEDKGKEETFSFAKGLFKTLRNGPKDCSEIRKDMIVAVVYDTVDSKKVIKSMSIAKGIK